MEIKTENQESYYGAFRNKLYNFFFENGVILSPVGKIVYISPPYVMTDAQLKKNYNLIERALNTFKFKNEIKLKKQLLKKYPYFKKVLLIFMITIKISI